MSDNNEAGKQLHQLLDEDWSFFMKEHPEAATHVGFPGQDDRWTDESLQGIQRRKARSKRSLQVLEGIQRAELSAVDQLNYDLYLWSVRLELDEQRFKGEYLPLNQMFGVQTEIPETLAIMPTSNQEAYGNILSRLEKVPELLDQVIVLMQKGVETGITPPRITLRDVPQQVQSIAADDGPLLRPFENFPGNFSSETKKDLRRQAESVIADKVRPAFGRLHEYLESDYIPSARESIGISEVPDGEAWYAHAVREHTTTDLKPAQIHEIGQSEVRRIRKEMEKIISDTGFDDSYDAFLEFLRRDARFFFQKPEELVAAYRDITKRADPELIRFFGHLPRLPYGVNPVPAYAEKSQPTAYYQPGSPEAARPGIFFANTYDLKARPRWEMQALSLHEAVPGHHLQIALAQEMDMPEFRRHGGFTAFIEGWGLYAESLGLEMGFYTDPYDRFGQLTYEMWRAIRLVVDTGMHAMGWTRDQAIAFFEEHAGKAGHDIIVEVDRYIVWPGQALAYKIGELKFKELRSQAREKLGESFDIRAFHDQVLGEGALPLDILADRMNTWVESQVSAR